MPNEKHPFLVAFDYMKAGYWGVMIARSESEIEQKWPELKVVQEKPRWMTEINYRDCFDRAYDIDGQPHGILNIILNSRERSLGHND
jgi:hypothetical protein